MNIIIIKYLVISVKDECKVALKEGGYIKN
jgi:hypothetical protein